MNTWPVIGIFDKKGFEMKKVFAFIAAVVILAGCSTGNGGMNKTDGGTIIGAILGGVIGSQFGGGAGKLVATGVGVLLGSLVGRQAGESMDRADQLYAARASHTALETTPNGQTIHWQNPNSGVSGSTTPTRTYQRTDGRYCREFQQTVTIGGKIESAYGKACRQPDGSWQIINNGQSYYQQPYQQPYNPPVQYRPRRPFFYQPRPPTYYQPPRRYYRQPTIPRYYNEYGWKSRRPFYNPCNC